MVEDLIRAQDSATLLPPISAAHADFDVEAAYRVLLAIESRRRAQGWRAVGRKIGFTNRTLWPRYGVFQPMWAHVWSHTVRFAQSGRGILPLAGLVQPRIEPEVAFKLARPVPADADVAAVLDAAEWMAPSFEVVQSHFPDWKFTAADCTAAFGLHGALLIGTPAPLRDADRAAVAAALPDFHLTLRHGKEVIDRGVGANVLGSPALALVHLVQLLAAQPQFPPLAAGEIVTTGTLTDAWPVRAGETWSSDYGTLGLDGLTVTFS